MFRLLSRSAVVLLLVAAAGCAAPKPNPDGPAKVEVRQVDGAYSLYVNGEPFYIRGAGLERQQPGAGSIPELAAHGANAFRTWRTFEAGRTGREILNEAKANGLMVMMGLEIGRERPGQGVGIFSFDYDDSSAVAAQLERVRGEVEELKDHPALLGWGIDNELNLGANNPKVWNAVNGISEMIHEIDPNHITTTMLAGIHADLVRDLAERAPDLDVVSIQSYADISNLPRYIVETGLDRPYIVTEWGATGHWEVATAPWGAPIENTSSVKADNYLERYQKVIAADTTLCLGSFVFLWGQKQERTPTWYGIFGVDGASTETVDVMEYLWTGSWPADRAPRLETAHLDGKTAYEGIELAPGQVVEAVTDASDPEGGELTFHWEVMHETTETSTGGDQESVPEKLDGLVADPAAATASVTAPTQPGPYRLFVYVHDAAGNLAHANIPFLVR